MQQQQIFTTDEVGKLLDSEFKKFNDRWHGVMNMSELQTLAKFIGQVKDEIKKPVTNPV